MNEEDVYIQQYKGKRRNNKTYKLSVQNQNISNKEWKRYRYHCYRTEMNSYIKHNKYDYESAPDSKSATPNCSLNKSPKDRYKNNVDYFKCHELYPSRPQVYGNCLHDKTKNCLEKGYVRYPHMICKLKHGKFNFPRQRESGC